MKKAVSWRLSLPAIVLIVLLGCDNPTSSDGTSNDQPNNDRPTDSVVNVDQDYGFQVDPDDIQDLRVLDRVPENNSTSIAPSSPVIVYFDDIVDPDSISSQTFSISVSEPAGTSGDAVALRTQASVAASNTGTDVFGTITVTKSADGNAAIIIFTPFDGFPTNSEITITISGDALLDDGGNSIGTA